MQDAHDLAEVARVLGAILGLGSVAALDRAKLAPQVPPSLIAKGRAAGKRLLCDQRAVAVRAEAVCEHALKQRLRRPSHFSAFCQLGRHFGHATIPPSCRHFLRVLPV